MPIIPGTERVVNGVVLNDKGEHVAYWIQTTLLNFERVEARSRKTGLLMAYMVYGLKYRLNNTRGVPMLSVVIESAQQIDRYKTATLANAEETAKVAYSIKHESFSTGENPLNNNVAKAINPTSQFDIPTDLNGNALQDKVATTTGKQVINLPIGASIEKLNHTAETNYKEFYDTNANAICSTVGIPPEVAFMKYDSNFSASRAALKDWEHTILVNRDETANDFYQPIYNLWLFIEVMTNKIQLPGYIQAFQEKNYYAMDAFQETMWKGPTVPHIDPLKEVNAVRAMLGDNGASIPLTTAENATEMLNQGDYDENIKQFAEELDDAKDLEVYIEPVRGGGQTTNPPQEKRD
jgi:capsid protein